LIEFTTMFICAAPVVLRTDLAGCMRRALQSCDLQHEWLAAAMGMGKAALSLALHGVNRFPYDRLVLAAETDGDACAVLTAFNREIEAALGISDTTESLLRRALESERRARMAVASLPLTQQEKRIA
jgi:hypothetical protein